MMLLKKYGQNTPPGFEMKSRFMLTRAEICQTLHQPKLRTCVVSRSTDSEWYRDFYVFTYKILGETDLHSTTYVVSPILIDRRTAV